MSQPTNDCKALETAVEQIALLAADLRVYRDTADNLSAQLKAVKELAAERSQELAALRAENSRLAAYHRDFIISLVNSKCADAPETAVLDDLIYDAYESDVVVALHRFTTLISRGTHTSTITPVKESLMFKSTRVYPQRALVMAAGAPSSQEPT